MRRAKSCLGVLKRRSSIYAKEDIAFVFGMYLLRTALFLQSNIKSIARGTFLIQNDCE